jgi:hypothetical protein
VSRRIILCDGAESARLWARIGTGSDENLTWVPRDNEPRARPPGFHALQGGLSAEAVGKLDAREGDGFAVVSEDLSFARSAVAVIGVAAAEAPILVLSDKIDADDLPDHPCCAAWSTCAS